MLLEYSGPWVPITSRPREEAVLRVLHTMSTTESPGDAVNRNVKAVRNDAEGTVTFVALPRSEAPVPDTEWITASEDTVVELGEHR